ncbi:MAG: glycosyltransferase family 9 protein [Chlamydiales bacterium]|nr:glycosyltransferase family 9 protein [Chlamydiales bacterium]
MSCKTGFKNSVIKALSSCFKGKKRAPADERRFLVVSTTGLGDTLWGVPAIRALRQNFPGAYIAVLTSPVGGELLKNNRMINELFVLKKPHLFSILSHFFQLRKRKIETILLFHASQRIVFPFCAFLNPHELIGTRGINKGLDILFSKTLENIPIHEVERRLKIVKETGAEILDPSLEFTLSPEDEKRAERFLKEKQISPILPLVGIHPGSKDEFKRWPEEHFIEVGNRLVNHLGCQVVVTGNRSEKELVERIASKIRGAVAMTGELGLGPLAALIGRFSLMLSNDTGPMHIAFAMKTPTVALFAPTDPKLCGPYYAPRSVPIYKKRTCTPCLRKKCAAPFCLLQISPQEVYDAALTLFYQAGAEKHV